MLPPVTRIDETFARTRAEGRPALVTYLTCGFPGMESTVPAVEGLLDGGADIIELGVPFSDPLADGPVIQRSSFLALEHGITLQACLDMARSLRERGATAPLVLMGYVNPILKRGVAAFARDAVAAGVDGVIIPDLPPDEAGQIAPVLRAAGLDTIFLLAPTSTPDRIEVVAKASSGFVYCVSVTGVTGERTAFDRDLAAFIARTREATDLPLAIGFGVSGPDQFAEVGALADGVVIGSAAIGRLESLPPGEERAGMADWARWIRGTGE